jgi:hypothetical protein
LKHSRFQSQQDKHIRQLQSDLSMTTLLATLRTMPTPPDKAAWAD